MHRILVSQDSKPEPLHVVTELSRDHTRKIGNHRLGVEVHDEQVAVIAPFILPVEDAMREGCRALSSASGAVVP